MKNKQLGVFNLMDRMYAEIFNVSVENFIEKIESISEKRQDVILSAIISGNDKKIEQAKRMFKSVQIKQV